MKVLADIGIIEALPIFFLAFVARYLISSGALYVFFWVYQPPTFKHLRIQLKHPPRGTAWREFRNSILSNVVFAFMGVGALEMTRWGWTQVYWDVQEYGWLYFAFSNFALILLHDAYFYFTHLVMHHPILFQRIHLVHHRSTNPTPWAAFSFNPAEAVVQSLFVNIVIMIMPLHPGALILWGVFMMCMNVIGHLGFELFPKGTPLKILNTSTHHNMHHRFINCNYGLYFNWWDRFFDTNHKMYAAYFTQLKLQREAPNSALSEESNDLPKASNE